MGRVLREYYKFIDRQIITRIIIIIIANLYFEAQTRDIVNRSIGLELKIKLTIICVNTETHEAHVHVNGM